MLKERWWNISQLIPEQLVLCDEHQSSWHAVDSGREGIYGQSQSPTLVVPRLEKNKEWMVWNDEELGENFKGLFESRLPPSFPFHILRSFNGDILQREMGTGLQKEESNTEHSHAPKLFKSQMRLPSEHLTELSNF